MPATNEIMIIAHRNAVQETLDREYDRQCNEETGVGKENRASSVVETGVNPMSQAIAKSTKDLMVKASEGVSFKSKEDGEDESDTAPLRERKPSNWFAAGTDDIKGFRAVLADTRYSLAHHVWENEGGEGRIAVRRPGQILMSAAIIISGVYGVYGALETSWTFDRDGLVGIMLDIGDEGSDLTKYSIWNVGLLLWKYEEKHNFLETFTIGFCALCCILFAFVFAVLQQVALLVLWLKPMTIKELKVMYFIVEVMRSALGQQK